MGGLVGSGVGSALGKDNFLCEGCELGLGWMFPLEHEVFECLPPRYLRRLSAASQLLPTCWPACA